MNNMRSYTPLLDMHAKIHPVYQFYHVIAAALSFSVTMTVQMLMMVYCESFEIHIKLRSALIQSNIDNSSHLAQAYICKNLSDSDRTVI